METKGNKPSLGWAILSLVLPVAMILYGTLVVGVRPPVLPLIGAVALAGLMGLKTGYRWEELQEGMFEALGRIQIAIAILALVGMIIAAWLASGTIPAIIYWGLKLIAPEHFLLSAMVLCSVASIATGTSFGTMGTIGVALLGVGQALGYAPGHDVGAIVSGAYIGDKYVSGIRTRPTLLRPSAKCRFSIISCPCSGRRSRRSSRRGSCTPCLVSPSRRNRPLRWKASTRSSAALKGISVWILWHSSRPS